MVPAGSEGPGCGGGRLGGSSRATRLSRIIEGISGAQLDTDHVGLPEFGALGRERQGTVALDRISGEGQLAVAEASGASMPSSPGVTVTWPSSVWAAPGTQPVPVPELADEDGGDGAVGGGSDGDLAGAAVACWMEPTTGLLRPTKSTAKPRVARIGSS